MPSVRILTLSALLLGMQALGGFTLLLATGLLGVSIAGNGLFWLLVGAGLFGLAVGSIALALNPPPLGHRAILVAGGLVAMVPGVGLGNGIFGYVATGLLLGFFYWRGMVLTGEHPGYSEVTRTFLIGFAVFFFSFVIMIARGTIFERSTWILLTAIGIAYLMIWMVGLVAAKIAQQREPGAGRAVASAVGAQLLLLLAVALLALQVFAFNLVGDFFQATHAFWDTLGSVAYQLALSIQDPFQHFISLIRRAGHHQNAARPSPPPGIGRNAPHKKLKGHHANNVPGEIVGIIFAVLILAAIAYTAWRVLPRLQRTSRRRAAVTEERRSLWSGKEAFTGLLNWLRSLFRRGARGTVVLAREIRKRITPPYPDDPVRRLYAQLLHRAESLGLLRSANVTPQEYCALLKARWPEGSSHFSVLTDAYIQRRYREVALPESAIVDLRSHWHEVRRVLRREKERVTESEADFAESRSLRGWRRRR